MQYNVVVGIEVTFLSFSEGREYTDVRGNINGSCRLKELCENNFVCSM